MGYLPNIFLFTQSFPYKVHQTEFSFLNLEVQHLLKKFNLTIIPLNISNSKYKISNKISVNTSLAKYYIKERNHLSFTLKAIFSLPFHEGIVQ